MKVERSSLWQSVSTWVVLVRIHHRNNLLPRLPLGPLNFDSRFHPHHIGTPLPFILNSRTMRRPTRRCLNAVPCRDRFTADAVQQPTILFQSSSLRSNSQLRRFSPCRDTAPERTTCPRSGVPGATLPQQTKADSSGILCKLCLLVSPPNHACGETWQSRNASHMLRCDH